MKMSKWFVEIMALIYVSKFGTMSMYGTFPRMSEWTWDIWAFKLVAAGIIIFCIEYLWRKL